MSAAVCVSVADLRREPVPATKGYERDFLQETQLLYGEQVIVQQQTGEWSLVEAVDQPKLAGDGEWKGYPGWVHSAHIQHVNYQSNSVVQAPWATVLQAPDHHAAEVCRLPFGAFCKIVDTQTKWLEVELIDGMRGYMSRPVSGPILQRATLFIGNPYLWGGCSPYQPALSSCNTSVDCSALLHLLFRSAGIRVPRDARDQHSLAQPVVKPRPGDLLFRANPETPAKIDHVMLVEGDEDLIEACLEAGCVRRITAKDKFGVPLNKLYNGIHIPGHAIFFGRIGKP